jgi:hypothetical protein
MSSAPRPIDLRRALLGHLLVAGAPVGVGALVSALRAELGDSAADPKRVSDMLRYQVGVGRVRRVGRGLYEVVPGALSKATAWRCVNWRLEQERADQRWLRSDAVTRASPLPGCSEVNVQSEALEPC